jgi:hypothetical protein
MAKGNTEKGAQAQKIAVTRSATGHYNHVVRFCQKGGRVLKGQHWRLVSRFSTLSARVLAMLERKTRF